MNAVWATGAKMTPESVTAMSEAGLSPVAILGPTDDPVVLVRDAACNGAEAVVVSSASSKIRAVIGAFMTCCVEAGYWIDDRIEVWEFTPSGIYLAGSIPKHLEADGSFALGQTTNQCPRCGAAYADNVKP